MISKFVRLVNGLSFKLGYGIGTPRDSPYRDLVTSAILKVSLFVVKQECVFTNLHVTRANEKTIVFLLFQLQEEQTLPHLYNTWWKEKQGGGCDEKDKSKKDKV